MPLAPFDELDQAGLRVLGFTIDVTRDGELAFQFPAWLQRTEPSGKRGVRLIQRLSPGKARWKWGRNGFTR
jgi:hypothetical protein